MNDEWSKCVELINSLPQPERYVLGMRAEHGMNALEISMVNPSPVYGKSEDEVNRILQDALVRVGYPNCL